MKFIINISAPFLLMLLLSCSSNKEVVKKAPIAKDNLAVKFIKNSTLTDVTEQAEREGKLVFLDLYTEWCLPCKLMTEDVYTDQRIGDFMNENFVNYKVDAEKGNGPNLRLMYGVENFPGLLFLDAKGRVLEKKLGAAYQTELMAMANRAMVKG